jgi:hypothetical protein
VQVEQIAAIGEIAHCLRQVLAREPGSRRRDDDIRGTDELLLGRVEIAHVDHQDAVGRQRRRLMRQLAPTGVGQPGRDRNRHSAEHAGEGRARRIEIAVGVEPDQTKPRRRTVRLLEPTDHAGNDGAVPADDQYWLARAATRGHRPGDLAADQTEIDRRLLVPLLFWKLRLDDRCLA